jgi:hypothetical protein
MLQTPKGIHFFQRHDNGGFIFVSRRYDEMYISGVGTILLVLKQPNLVAVCYVDLFLLWCGQGV